MNLFNTLPLAQCKMYTIVFLVPCRNDVKQQKGVPVTDSALFLLFTVCLHLNYLENSSLYRLLPLCVLWPIVFQFEHEIFKYHIGL